MVPCPQENPNFYDPFFSKEGGIKKYLSCLNDFLVERGFILGPPLQYDDLFTKLFAVPKVYLAFKEERKYKVRVCNSEEDALRIFGNLRYAWDKGLPVSLAVECTGPFVILEYLPGDTFSSLQQEDIAKIASIHAKLNHPLNFNSQSVRASLTNLITLSSGILSDLKVSHKHRQIAEECFPSELFPVFDHQDLGVHNLISFSDNFFLIDEEAFGVLPFGYTLHRAMNGRKNYRVCDTDSQIQTYLSCFAESARDYYLKTRPFWNSVYKLREGSRIAIGTNKDLARRFFENDP